jgi:hypothetical protein
VSKVRLEISTNGFDEALQGITSDPFAPTASVTYTGLRIPVTLPTDGPPAQPRYLFNLASLTFQNNVRLMGIRQGLTIGVDANQGTLPEWPTECWVRTPTFRFVDGNVCWMLVREKNPQQSQQKPLTDTQNWAKTQSDSPAMLYNTFTNTNTTLTGAPVVYFEGLSTYTPPPFAGYAQQFETVAGLGNFKDLRFPWENTDAWQSFGSEGILLEGSGRLTLYASVLQTNPATRGTPTQQVTNLSSSATPEEAFIKDMSATIGEGVHVGPNYWRILGALLVEIDQ